LIPTEDGTADLRKLAVMIRSEFHLDPYQLSEKEFAQRAADVIWLYNHRFTEQKAAVREGALEAYNEVIKAKNKR